MSIADEAPAGTDDFPIIWEDERDPMLAFERDDMHMPFVITPLAEDYVRVLGAGFNECYEIFGDFPQRMVTRVWNGYAYFAIDRHLSDEDAITANRERWFTVIREREAITEAYWRDEVLPEVKELEAGLRAIRVDALERAELAAAWDFAWSATARLWQLHFNTIHPAYQVVEDLADLFERHFPDASPHEAQRLVQGTRNELVDMDLGMERLAAIAAGSPDIAARLVEAATGPQDRRRHIELGELSGLAGAAELLAELETFLARHGHLGQGLDDLALASWADDPPMVLANVGARLATPPEPTEARRERLAAEAEELAERVRERLADDPDELATFERLFGYGRAIAPLTEVHNYWIDRMAQARMRTLAMRVGERLVREGVFEEREDILHLHRDEVRELILEPADRRAFIAERQARHERRRAMNPPRNVGAPPPPPVADRFEADHRVSEEPDVLLGTGASAGVVRGPARVALGPEDFARISAGDIIVCPSSNPSWVPVFTIAGGLVTNTGGVLSHAAVVAREFGLPAVVGADGATTRIADGRLIEIDGTKGSVRLL